MTYYINMEISTELGELDEIRQKWIKARLAFREIEAERLINQFRIKSTEAYNKLRNEYIKRGVPFSNNKIKRMVSL